MAKSTSRHSLDSYDMKILKILSSDGRINWSDLADRIGLSMTPTIRRVRRLETDGFIEGYGAKLDETRLIGPLAVVMAISLERHSERAPEEIKEKLLTIDEVIVLNLMAGGAEFMLRATVRDMDHYQRLFRFISALPDVARVDTSFVLDLVRSEWAGS